MADYTSTGYQANVNGGSGSGVQIMDPLTGRWIDAGSSAGQSTLRGAQTNYVNSLQQKVNANKNLATAEVEADAQAYEADQNRAAGQQAFQFALSQAGGRRQPGGGIARGGYGRRGMTLNQATGGLAAANAAARKKAQMGLAQARVAADPENQMLQTQIDAARPIGGSRRSVPTPRLHR